LKIIGKKGRPALSRRLIGFIFAVPFAKSLREYVVENARKRESCEGAGGEMKFTKKPLTAE